MIVKSLFLSFFSGCTVKKVTYRNATLQLGRNEFRDVMLRLETGKKSQRYSVKEVQLLCITSNKQIKSLVDHYYDLCNF